MLSTFNSLASVDYGSNAPEGEPREFGLWSPTEVEDYSSCDPSQFMAWFHLSAVESLSIWLRSFDGVITSGDQGNLRNLHTLTIARAAIEEEAVPEILSQTAALRTLHLGMAYEWEGGEKVTPVHRESILDGLMSVKDTVEKLFLGCGYYPENCGQYSWSFFNEDETSELYEGFLHEFNGLRSVEILIYMLLSLRLERTVDISSHFPSTLEEICLRMNDLGSKEIFEEPHMHDCVRYLLEDRTCFPDLKRLSIRMSYDDDRFLQERGDLGERCAKTGIRFSVTVDDLSPGLWTQDNTLLQ